MNVRRRGHDFERKVRLDLLPYYPECITTRLGSRYLDNKGIDLMNTGVFTIQCKDSNRVPDYHTLLKSCNVVIHNYRSKTRRTIKTVVILEESFYLSLCGKTEMPTITKSTKIDYVNLDLPFCQIKKDKKYIFISYGEFIKISQPGYNTQSINLC